MNVSGVRDNVQTHKANNVYEGNAGPGRSKAVPGEDLEAELARVHAMLAHNSKVYKVFVYIHALIFVYIILYLNSMSLLALDFSMSF